MRTREEVERDGKPLDTAVTVTIPRAEADKVIAVGTPRADSGTPEGQSGTPTRTRRPSDATPSSSHRRFGYQGAREQQPPARNPSPKCATCKVNKQRMRVMISGRKRKVWVCPRCGERAAIADLPARGGGE